MRSVSFRLVATSLLLGGCTGAIGQGQSGPASGQSSGDTTKTTSAQCASAPMASGHAYVRRLARWEYLNTVADVLNVQLNDTDSGLVPADIHISNGFSNDSGGQLASFDTAIAYGKVADAVGVALTKSPAWLTSLSTCTDTGAACRDGVVRALALRLFRHPATADESAAFGALFDTAVAAGMKTASDAAVVVVRAMLQSPQFLYKLEAQTPVAGNPNARPLDSYEMATRLSYLTWGSAPDQALLDAAAKGDLLSADKVRAQVSRMLTLPRARQTIQRYFRDWLSLDDLDDATRTPAFTPALAADMKKETLDVVGDQLWDAHMPLISTMLTTRTTMVTPPLAVYYGLGMPDATGHLSLANAPNRAGLLTHAGVQTIAGDADANVTIIYRGLYVFQRFMCQPVGTPPPGATSVPLAPETVSGRQKSDARLAHEPCATCHGQFDPLAYAFEPFDTMGAVMVKDANGNAVRQDGWVTEPGSTGPKTGKPYTDVVDYMNLLSQDPRVGTCVAAKVAQFAWGRGIDMTGGDQCMLADIQTRMNASQGHTFADLLTAVATNPNFRYTAVQ